MQIYPVCRWSLPVSFSLFSTTVLWLTTAAGGAETRVEFYPATAGAAIERRVEVKVQGEQTPLTLRRVWHADSSGQRFMGAAAARFAADGPVNVTLTARGGTLGQPVLRTVGQDLAVKRSGAALSFELPGSGQY